MFFLTHIHAYEDKIQRHRLEIISSETELNILNDQHAQCGQFLCFTGREFIEIYDRLERTRGIQYTEYVITGDLDTDEYMRRFAEARGYEKRTTVDTNRLIEFNGLQVLPEVRDAYLLLRNRMSEDGIDLHLVSAYRSFENQRSLFMSMLGVTDFEGIKKGLYDTELTTVLERSALPGYSKHHSGYAVDFGCGDKYLVFKFSETECYQWMSENNFERVKMQGFIPSYPEDVEYQGPRPEPWEYVWVGSEELR